MTNRLVLFDIDQTLIDAAGCGRRALEKAMREHFGLPEILTKIVMNGKTDTSIVEEALSAQGVAGPIPSLMWTAYVEHLNEELKQSPSARPQPGAFDLLNELRKMPGVYLGLLTGNIRKAAQTKLGRFGLWDYFPTGGFGDDDPDRNRVAEIAILRCSRHYGMAFSANETFVVGDSLRDIECAEAISARAVAVATGPDTFAMLESRKPYALFRNLSDTEAVLSALQGKAAHETNPRA